MTEHWSKDWGFNYSKLSYPEEYVPEQKNMLQIRKEVGSHDFKKLYCMDYPSFQRFCDLLYDAFLRSGGEKVGIPLEMCLAVAIICFKEGCSLYTCAQIHGLPQKKIYDGTAYIVDAIHLFLQENKIRYKKGTPMLQKVRNLVKSHILESSEGGDY